MKVRMAKVSIIIIFTLIYALFSLFAPQTSRAWDSGGTQLDQHLSGLLTEHGFTGGIDGVVDERLGRNINNNLADLGRNLFFDTIAGLNNDNNCAGCHVPGAGFGDAKSIAIGIENSGIAGPNRAGPRNQRRTPSIVNTALYPTLMWNSRFASHSRDPFDNSLGFLFPLPEGDSLNYLPHLLTAQAFIPPTERVEMAGFSFPGDNDAIRGEVLRRINAVFEYRKRFGKIYPSVRSGGPITFDMFGAAVAEFEFSQVYADAPIDRFGRGQRNAMTESQKKGAVLFFGTANCVACHRVAGDSNEMFSDFEQHVIGVPQVAPSVGNVVFDGPGQNEDFGLEQFTGDPADRYKFRTSPLRNAGLQPTFFHNGAFTTLEDAVRHHLNVYASALNYDPAAAGLEADLHGPTGPIEPVLMRLDPLLSQPIALTEDEFRQLVDFIRYGLLDPRARPDRLKHLIPREVPSGMPMQVFE